ncbi:MAG: sulfatase-like hydrolase/transferase [Lentisphaerales bacterium]|nr:sulfatase-like hydrolase/transferase [Lentisphaerales bacterium]
MRFNFYFLVLLLGMTAYTEDKKPNILFILTDDQSHRTVSCYDEAHDWVQTPHIDALAKKGMRFTSAYIGTWCMPARATLMTGKLQYNMESMKMAGEYPGSVYDPKKLPYFPKVFRDQGYVTGMVGKWHTGIDSGAKRDWDYQAVWNRPKYVKNAGHYYYDQLIEFNGEEPHMISGYSTDNYTKWAEEFINNKELHANKPWYLWVCYAGVHGPFTPADRHMNQYPGVKVPIPEDIYPPRKDKPAYASSREKWIKDENGVPQMQSKFSMRTVQSNGGVHGNTLDDWVRQYQEAVSSLDDGVGRLVQSLKDSGQYENTLIIFTSDQGLAWGQHGFNHKLAPYDANIKSPMIVSMAGKIKENTVCTKPVSGTDIVPTIFDYANLELPWQMDGRSIRPLLTDHTTEWNYPVLTTYTGQVYGSDTHTIPKDKSIYSDAGVPWWTSVVSGRYKYIETHIEGEPAELYDLKNDPEELHNLAYKAEYKEETIRMKKLMTSEMKRTNCGFVDKLPAVKK